MSDPRLLHKLYKFCEKQKELTNEFKAKVILYFSFHDVSKKAKIFKQKYRFFPRRVTEKRHRSPPPLPPPPTLPRAANPNVLVGKIDM